MSLQVPIELHNALSLYFYDTAYLLCNAYSIDKASAPFIYPVQRYLNKVSDNLWTMHEEYAELLDACVDQLGHRLREQFLRDIRTITARIATARASINNAADFIASNKDALVSGLKQQIELPGATQFLLYIPWLDITMRTSLLDRLPTDVDDVVALHHRLVEQLDDFEEHMRHMNLLLLHMPSDTDLVVFVEELRVLAAVIRFLVSPLLMQGSHRDLEDLAIPGPESEHRRLEDNVIKHNLFGFEGRVCCDEKRGPFHDHD